MSEEQKRILQMVSEGKINVDEAERLLKLLDSEPENGDIPPVPPVPPTSPRRETTGGPTTGKTIYTGFTRVEAHSAVDADLTRGAQYSVEISNADAHDVEISQDGETLKIRRPGYFGFGWWGNWGARARVRITMPEIRGVAAHGASYIKVQGFHSENELFMLSIGASRIKLVNISAGSCRADVTGASSLSGDIVVKGTGFISAFGASHARLTGSAHKLTLRLSGASNFKMSEFTADEIDAHFNGACNGSINVTSRLDANLSGASNLNYSGSPVMGNIITTGASHLNHTTAPPVPPAPPVFS